MTRPRAQIEMDIRYAIRLNELHRRWYRKLKFITSMLSLLAGSAALATIFGAAPIISVVAAVVVAACGFADLLGQWSDKASRRCEYIRAYQGLLSSQLTDGQMQDGLEKVYAMVSDHDIEALRTVAYNDTSLSWGWDHNVIPETFMQRLWRSLA